MTKRFTPFAATHAIVKSQNQEILMLRRYKTGWMDGLFTVPAGHIDEGESAVEAAARELFEETGLSVDPTAYEHAVTVHRQDEEGVVYFDNYFVFSDWSGEATITEPNKADAIEWIHVDNLGSNCRTNCFKCFASTPGGLTIPRRWLESISPTRTSPL